MAISKLSSAVRSLLETLIPSHRLSAEQLADVWGPVVAYQHDTNGSRIQKYLTLLVRETSGKWIMVRQINKIENGYEWTSRPIAEELSETSSQHWLLQNKMASSTALASQQ